MIENQENFYPSRGHYVAARDHLKKMPGCAVITSNLNIIGATDKKETRTNLKEVNAKEPN